MSVKKRLEVRASIKFMDRIERQAEAEGLSRNALVVKALELYITKDITDESLLMAQISEAQRVIQLLEKKQDIFQKLTLDFYQYFFMFHPDMPAEKGEAARLYRRGDDRTNEMLARFRERLTSQPALVESLLADYLESGYDGA